MVTNQQVKRLWRLLAQGKPLYQSAQKAGMSMKTGRKYRNARALPGELAKPHTWRTRKDPFAEVLPQVFEMLEKSPGLQAKTILEELQHREPGVFKDGQLRTLQRVVKGWRALKGPAREVYFPQRHDPARLCQSDFTNMNALGITICGEPLQHLVYHFVLTYSNWETFSLCFSESFESLSDGLQSALWELGGVPEVHRSDRLSAAVHNLGGKSGEFTARYQALLSHYGLTGQRIQAAKANENGDVEQRHYRFKVAVEQALMLRGSQDFESRGAYEQFLRELVQRLNAGRTAKFQEELALLRPLPSSKLAAVRWLQARVTSWSTVNLERRTYSVHSRLRGEQVKAKLSHDTVEIYFGDSFVEAFPRLSGADSVCINYRHIIDSLVRKPGAFERYLYRDALFPTSYFRMAYDHLVGTTPLRAVKEYLRILELAAKGSEEQVNAVLKDLVTHGQPCSATIVAERLKEGIQVAPTDIVINPISLDVYDDLLCIEGDSP